MGAEGIRFNPLNPSPSLPTAAENEQSSSQRKKLVLQAAEATNQTRNLGRKLVLELAPPMDTHRVPFEYSPTNEIANLMPNGRVFKKDANKKVLFQNEHDEKGAGSSNTTKEGGYDVATHLKNVPAHISIWELLMTSEAHRKKFVEVLNGAHLPKETTPETIAQMIGQIMSPQVITFNNHELPKEGKTHVKPLSITVKHADFKIPLVLIDNGSGLNVCPKRTLDTLGIGVESIRPKNMTVRAFDNSRKVAIGEIDLDLVIGPKKFTVPFQVLDIPASFNLLLGRPWIHEANAVPSSLHQRVKFPMEGQVIVVLSETEAEITSESQIPVVQIEHSPEDIPFLSFQFEVVVNQPAEPPKKVDPVFPFADRLLSQFKAKNKGKFKMIKTKPNIGTTGLGFKKKQAQKDNLASKTVTFVRKGVLDPNSGKITREQLFQAFASLNLDKHPCTKNTDNVMQDEIIQDEKGKQEMEEMQEGSDSEPGPADIMMIKADEEEDGDEDEKKESSWFFEPLTIEAANGSDASRQKKTMS